MYPTIPRDPTLSNFKYTEVLLFKNWLTDQGALHTNAYHSALLYNYHFMQGNHQTKNPSVIVITSYCCSGI